ncbi:MAG: 50S ribosomal protein L5 [Candidatus Omnitrophica bacterium]|nr:50S ribosomal protein L5 [Candidatus Omnitrophota bacterium]
MKPRFLEKYKNEIVPDIMQRFSLKNKFEVPRIEKIVLNMGIGGAAHDNKLIEDASGQLATITGQRPALTKARKSISNFKIRKGSIVGCRVTLRGRMMYEFLDRLVSAALPRIKDFRGFSANSFDAAGNYSFGLSEQTIFPEIDIDKVQRIQGMDITIVTTGKRRDLTLELLKGFSFPFRRD